jgi:hypothetical protein
MVNRRIVIMRRRDHALEQENAEESGFAEGMFGGILQMPLPVPEILSSLDKSTFESKQKKHKLKSKDGLWKQCPICWSDFRRREMVTTLICDEKHVFHTDCIEEWIRKGHNTCPLCRLPIANL